MKAIQFKNALLLSVVALFLMSSSCKEDTSHPLRPVQNNIIDRALPSANYNVTTIASEQTYYEMGFKFTVNEVVKVTKMGVKTPDVDVYRVLLWDFDMKTILGQVSCNHTNATAFTIVSTGKMGLVPSKNHLITFRTKGEKRYDITPKTGTIPFPIRATLSIPLTDYVYYSASLVTNNGDTPKFPTVLGLNTFARGFPEFEFQPDVY